MALSRFVLTQNVTLPWPATWSELIQGAAAVPVTTPAVPASGTAEANGNGVPVAVTVSGGTVTAINVGSNAANLTATGFTSGTVIVPNGYAISITYSVAPTWTWAAAQLPQSGSSSMAVAVSNPAPSGGQLGQIPSYTWLKGTTIYADSAAIPAGTPGSGAQQLYQLLSANLRAWVDGQDVVGHAALSN